MERYESLGPVGEGSYGTVLKCRHRDSGRLVAIKKFMDSDNDKTVKKIALREIKLLRQLRHDNLVNLLEVWKRRRRWYLVFEFVDRTLLDELEQKSSGLDLNTCQQYLFQILRAANFCHQQNVIHRDIKPENILISQEGVVKLCDFGFARTIASPSEGGVYTDYVATRWYRAPELLVGDIKYGKPVDVWALGCLLIEMLTGQPLFPGDSDLDQIYHIVRCFGNLTAHHQELFHRNPIFSGVKLPECSKTVPLQQRFPTIPPTALDLAQKCLEMDPKRRAQCSNLLDHLLFTQGSFSIRFLDELNTKIQKKHRENSTLPKIPKTTLQDDGKGEDKNCISKDKKQLEEMEEKGNKEKMEKTKGKQPPKLFKSIHNTTESFMTKPPKTFSNKAINHTEQLSMKPEKTSSSGLKELEVLKSTKICISESADVTKTAVSLKKKSSVAAKPKYEWGVSPDPRKDHLHNAKDIDYSNRDSEKILLIGELLKSETSKEFVRSLSNLSLNISKLSKIAITDGQSLNSSPKTVLESDSSVEPTFPLLSFNDYTVPTMLDVTRSGKTSLALKFQTDILDGDAKQNSSECPKVQPKNPRKSQTISTSVQQNHDNTSISHSRAAVDLSSQTFMTVREPSAAYNLSALPRGISHSTVPKTTYSTKTPSKDKEPTENHEMRKYHRYPKLNPMTETPTKPILLSHILDGDRESSEPYFALWQSNVITEEVKLTSTPVLDENLSVEKAQTVSVKENQEDLPISVCINKTLKPPERSANDRGNNSSQEFRFDVKSLNISHHSQHPTTGQSFSDHLRSSVNPKTQNITFTPDAKKKSNKPEINSTHMSTDLTSVMSGDHKALTRSLILHEKETADIDEFNYSVLQSCTPSPPPAPAANCLHLPPSSRTLAPTIFLSSSNSPAPSDHLIQRGGSHTRTNSLRKIDQPFGLNHATRSFAFQASGNSFINERSKNSVHFPDVRSSVLPELSGKEAKQNKVATKEQRTEKTPVSSDGQ